MLENDVRNGHLASVESIVKEFEVGKEKIQEITNHFVQQMSMYLPCDLCISLIRPIRTWLESQAFLSDTFLRHRDTNRT
jgi:hexokinase